MTTHDRVWLNFMREEKLITHAVTFGGWSVDTGPLVLDDADMMDRVLQALNEGDVQTAAGRLRHYLEHLGYILCDGLRASVPFRGDGQYTLNDTLPQGISAVKKRLKEARNAAVSWGKKDDEQTAAETLDTYTEVVEKCKILMWGINPAVHFNQWENFEPSEFREIVDAYIELLKLIRCETCSSLLHLTYSGVSADSMSCVCGSQRFNLKKK